MTIVYLSNKVREAVIMIILSSLNVVIRHAWLYEYYECLIDSKKRLLHHKMTTFISQIFMAFLTFCLFNIIIIIFILEKEKLKYFWVYMSQVYMSQGFFSTEWKIICFISQFWLFSGNCKFISHKSDFFPQNSCLFWVYILHFHILSFFY